MQANKFKARRERLYNVELRYLNPNADRVITVSASSKANALWVAAERVIGDVAMPQIGGIVAHNAKRNGG